MSETLAFAELLRRLCDTMVLSVEQHETRTHRRRGCMAGIALCRTLTSAADFERVIAERKARDRTLRTFAPLEQYWEERCATAQVEYAFEVIKVAVGGYPHVRARAALQYQRLFGN